MFGGCAHARSRRAVRPAIGFPDRAIARASHTITMGLDRFVRTARTGPAKSCCFYTHVLPRIDFPATESDGYTRFADRVNVRMIEVTPWISRRKRSGPLKSGHTDRETDRKSLLCPDVPHGQHTSEGPPGRLQGRDERRKGIAIGSIEKPDTKSLIKTADLISYARFISRQEPDRSAAVNHLPTRARRGSRYVG
jgi:hypothetical protein